MLVRRAALLCALFAGLVVAVLFRQAAAVPVPVRRVTLGEVTASIDAPCSLEYVHTADLRPEVTARIADVRVRAGDHVRQGQVVVELDERQLQATIAQAQAQQNRAVAEIDVAQLDAQRSGVDLDTYEKLAAQGFYPRLQLTQARLQAQRSRMQVRAAVASSRAQESGIRNAQEELRKYRITAPIDGVVTAVNIHVGETAIASAAALPGSLLLSIADPAAIRAKVQIDEADAPRVSPGMAVDVTLPGTAGLIQGQVERLSTTVVQDPKNPNHRFVDGEVVLPVVRDGMRSGSTCVADVVTRTRAAAPRVPVEALVYDEADKASKHAVLWQVVRGRAHKLAVRTDILGGDYVTTSPEVPAGALVVSDPEGLDEALQEGRRVRPRVAR